MPTGRPIPLVDLERQHEQLRTPLLDAMAAVLDSGRFISGPVVEQFEGEFAAYLGAAHVVGCSNGTAALEIVLRALDIGPGAEVIIPAMTFAATAEAVCLAGATPVLVDVDPLTGGLDVDAAAAAVTSRTEALVPVHLHGIPAPMAGLAALAQRHELALVEDAAQAHGARVGGRRAGTLGVAGCFSFYPGKNLGALGDAGAVATDDAEVAAALRSLRDHGRQSKHHHGRLGGNHRMDELQAAVLRIKLPLLDEWNERRRTIAAHYDEAFRPAGLRQACSDPGDEPIHHVYAIEVDERDSCIDALADRGIATGIHYPVPLHEQPGLTALVRVPHPLPVSERLASRTLSIPMSAELDDDDVQRVVDAVLAVARP